MDHHRALRRVFVETVCRIESDIDGNWRDRSGAECDRDAGVAILRSSGIRDDPHHSNRCQEKAARDFARKTPPKTLRAF